MVTERKGNPTNLAQVLEPVLIQFVQKHDGEYSMVKVSGTTPWDMIVEIATKQGRKLTIRSLKDDNLKNLLTFGDQLGEVSKDLFCPYPWKNKKKLTSSLLRAIGSTLEEIDVSYLMFFDNNPIGHFFLWKAQDNPNSKKYGLQIPELGVAVADRYQGSGFGKLSVEILQAVAIHLKADAVELTTALANNAGWNTYLRTGFEYTGLIKNPLEVDVTEFDQGKPTTQKYREERQMVYIIDNSKRTAILAYLFQKR